MGKHLLTLPVLLFVLLPASAASFRCESGNLALDFEETGGALVAVTYNGREIARCEATRTPVTFGFGPADKTVWLEHIGEPRRLVGRKTPRPGCLDVKVAAGPFEWTERYEILDGGRRLDRSVELVSRSDDELRLRGFGFMLHGVKAPPGGCYAFPAKWPPARHAFAELREGTRRWGGGSLAPVVAELGDGLTLAWASFARDAPSLEVSEGRGNLRVRQNLLSVGRLRPGVAQKFGPVSMLFAEGGYRAGLERLQAWLGDVGLRLPADRAEWLGASAMYSFHPGGTIGSGWKDLGGFARAEQVVPSRMKRLNATAAWILPVEHKSPYWPIDYYRFMDGLGGSNAYRRLVAHLHDGGFRVLQDIVPHGGAPYAVHNQAHPEFMLRREDGSTLSYWLNDFARPDWQAYVAGVARHYVRAYGIDGYRVDACYGSKEPNWSSDIPYARASMARLHGGLGMMRAIRDAVKAERPDAALLAEVESERHLQHSDAMYDFTFGLTVCRDWLRREPAEFVRLLRTFLDEQRYVVPPGAPRLRFIESHDTTRSQGWYGVRGMRAMYALSAWIDGTPMIYQGMDAGHGPALAEINRIRNAHRELRAGHADYVDTHGDPPEVFAASRFRDGRATTFAINFGRETVRASLTQHMTGAVVTLKPLEYTILTRQKPGPLPKLTYGATTNLAEEVVFEDAMEWFVDSVEGRLHDWYDGATAAFPARGGSSSIYWRPQGRGDLWQNALTPLHPTAGRIGVRGGDGRWRGYDIGTTNAVRLCDQSGGRAVLTLLGAGGVGARTWEADEQPPDPDVTRAVDLGGVGFRVVGPDYIVSNSHYTVILRRTGGVVRELHSAAGERLAQGQDLYGDQVAFHAGNATRVAAQNEGETAIRIWRATDGLHLAFGGHLRGSHRFALKRPALVFRNEYIFTSGPSFVHRWSFRTEKPIRDKPAFLTFQIPMATGDAFRFVRKGTTFARESMGSGSGRKAFVRGRDLPDTVVFERNGDVLWSLRDVSTPGLDHCRAFVVNRMVFLTLLDGAGAAMEAGQDYAFSCRWQVEGGRGN